MFGGEIMPCRRGAPCGCPFCLRTVEDGGPYGGLWLGVQSRRGSNLLPDRRSWLDRQMRQQVAAPTKEEDFCAEVKPRTAP